jgi:glycosyltransferase involved in cell wall biosynthesis/CDP-glycerol glycerophosphotransferase (TagB/SpsB family)
VETALVPPARRFSVVTAMYNAAPWLEEYFQSLVRQSIGFEQALEIILVDDGSTDSSPALAASWAARYPGNITCLSQEHAGPAAARNLGLGHARGEWLTFIDADDFVHDRYFAVVAAFLASFPDFDGAILSCLPIAFNEADGGFSNKDPLNYKYVQEKSLVDIEEYPEFVQLSVANCFFRADVLRESGLTCPDRSQPSFAEGHFLYSFFLASGRTKVAFLRKAVYFRRECVSPASLNNAGWERREKYRDQILFGYIDLVRRARKKLGRVPPYVQYAIVRESQDYMDRMLDGTLPYDFTPEEGKDFFALMRSLFMSIEVEHILFSRLPTLSWRTRIALLRAFKGVTAAGPLLVQAIAPDRKSLLLARYGAGEEKYEGRAAQGDEIVLPLWEKRVSLNFLGEDLGVTRYLWFPLELEKTVGFFGGDQALPLLCRDELFEQACGREILAAFYLPPETLPERIQDLQTRARSEEARAVYENCWILADRIDRADDNAEHFYRYLAGLPDVAGKIFFVLKKETDDWERLEKEGFRLLRHGSEDHFTALCNAQWIISSHVHRPVFDPLQLKSRFGLPEYKIAFLPHGITQGDVSKWLDPMPVDLFVLTGAPEHESVLRGKSRYMERELRLTGFPRQDSLLALKRKRRPLARMVLLCPTWRDSLCNPHTHESPDAAEAAMFMASDYFKAWNALVQDEEFADLAEQYGYRALFFPHPYVSRNLGLFSYSRRVLPRTYRQTPSVQALLAETDLLVTDYSSMAFEISLLGTPVAYYHFAETPPFFSSHTYSRGYFDYRRDGFGPVFSTLEDLRTHLAKMFAGGCAREPVYTARAEKFFPFRDGKNCSRVYAALRGWGEKA